MDADPYEWTNLADDPNLAEVKLKLKNKLELWMNHCGDRGQQTEVEARQHQNGNRNKTKSRTGAGKNSKKPKLNTVW